MSLLLATLQVGSDSYQGAGAPTMFEAMRRIVSCLGQKTVGECGFSRAIRHSFLGILSPAAFFLQTVNCEYFVL